MKFEVIGFKEKTKWSELAKDREVYYQWQYVDAFRVRGDGTPMLAYATNGKETAINVFFLRSINKDLDVDLSEQWYDIVTPYGYGGVDYNGENNKLLHFFFERFEEYCHENNIISEFIRLCPFTNNFKNYNTEDYQLIKVSSTVSMKLISPEQIWNDMEGRCRTSIRKAIKSNLKVESGFSKEEMENFKTIYKETMNRDDATSYYYFNDAFFESILNNLGQFARIYTVKLEDKPISSSIILYNNTSAHYHLSGTLSEYMKYCANNLVLYQVALDLCERHFRSFHLGGGYGGDLSPLFKFKRSFNKYSNLSFYIGKRIYDKEKYDELCKRKNIPNDEKFFPAYRRGLE